MKYIVPQEIKSETKVTKGIYVFDFFFLIIYASVTMMLKNMVNGTLQIPFIIFSVLMAVVLIGGSTTNRRRRNYQALVIYLNRDRAVYRPVGDDMKEGENV